MWEEDGQDRREVWLDEPVMTQQWVIAIAIHDHGPQMVAEALVGEAWPGSWASSELGVETYSVRVHMVADPLPEEAGRWLAHVQRSL